MFSGGLVVPLLGETAGCKGVSTDILVVGETAYCKGVATGIADSITSITSCKLALTKVKGSSWPATPHSLAAEAITSPALIESKFRSSSNFSSKPILSLGYPVCSTTKSTKISDKFLLP